MNKIEFLIIKTELSDDENIIKQFQTTNETNKIINNIKIRDIEDDEIKLHILLIKENEVYYYN